MKTNAGGPQRRNWALNAGEQKSDQRPAPRVHMSQVTVIYKNVPVLAPTFRCGNCKVHFICGVCPRFCPVCASQFTAFLDAAVDKAVEPERRWSEGEITPVPYEGRGCLLAYPPSGEEIDELRARLKARWNS